LRHKLSGYSSVDEFATDLQRVIAGLLEASISHSTVHRTAVKMKDQVSTEQHLSVRWKLFSLPLLQVGKEYGPEKNLFDFG